LSFLAWIFFTKEENIKKKDSGVKKIKRKSLAALCTYALLALRVPALSQLRCSLYCSYPSHIFLKSLIFCDSPLILSDLLSALCLPLSELATSTVALLTISYRRSSWKKEGRKDGRMKNRQKP
jgi:hypothetical protein